MPDLDHDRPSRAADATRAIQLATLESIIAAASRLTYLTQMNQAELAVYLQGVGVKIAEATPAELRGLVSDVATLALSILLGYPA